MSDFRGRLAEFFEQNDDAGQPPDEVDRKIAAAVRKCMADRPVSECEFCSELYEAFLDENGALT